MLADPVDVIEAAYRVEQTPADWLADVHGVVERSFGNAAVFAYFVDCSGGGFRRWEQRWSPATPPEVVALSPEYDAYVPLPVRRAIHMFAPAGSNDDLPEPSENSDWFVRETARWRVLGVNALDASLKGCCFSRWQLRAASARVAPAEIEHWSRLAAHLAAGARLTHALSDLNPIDRAEAVLDAGGKLLHASGLARSQLARDALREAARTQDRARTRGRRTVDAVAAWEALVKGRWSIVDHFDHDGRRLVVAQPNAPEAVSRRSLSPRESQVAGAAALGHSNKLIAYELGLAPSTVAKLLARARAKLGVRSRVELIAALARTPED